MHIDLEQVRRIFIDDLTDPRRDNSERFTSLDRQHIDGERRMVPLDRLLGWRCDPSRVRG